MQSYVKITIATAIAIAVIVLIVYSLSPGAPLLSSGTSSIDDIPSVLSNSSTVTTVTNQTLQQRKEVTLSAMLTGDRWNGLLQEQNVGLKLPIRDIDLKIVPTIMPYEESRSKISDSIRNRDPVDIISLDQVWLGGFADTGMLADLSNRSDVWAGLRIGIKLTGMAVCTMAKYMQYGPGLM